MIDIIKRVLGNNQDINGWKVIVHETKSDELFFIGNKLDMNRSKNVADYVVTVY